jgi:hypothetical protein
MTVPFRLSDRERATLAAVCDAFHPSLTAEAGDDPLLFSTSASSLGVSGAAEDAIALLAPAQRTELRQLLWLLRNGLFTWLVGGTASGITRMSREQSERFLSSLATSSIPQLRGGFQAFKRLSSFLYYSVTDANGENRGRASGTSRPPCRRHARNDSTSRRSPRRRASTPTRV